MTGFCIDYINTKSLSIKPLFSVFFENYDDNDLISHLINCPGGEIGRRTVFRWRRREVCWFESSPGHDRKSPARSVGLFYLAACKACFVKQTNKKDRESEANQDFFIVASS